VKIKVMMMAMHLLLYKTVYQGCTTHLTDIARNILGSKVGGHSGGLGTVPPVESRCKAPDQGVGTKSP